MHSVPDEITKQTAATREGRRSTRRLASQEFFFLLQRIDRLDEKFTEEIKRLDDKFTGEIKRLEAKFDEKFERLNDRFDSAKFWFISAVVTIIATIIGSRFI